jgi:hypothetical protein
MPKFQGQDVTIKREARGTDTGFQAGKDQLLITTADGREKVVLRSEVEGLDQGENKDQGKKKTEAKDEQG